MTEQEFREKLKQSVGHTELSPDRQYRVLARMKGGRRKVCSWSKMKISIVISLVVLMTMGAAVATEFVKYVNWEGNPIDYTPPEYQTLDVPVDMLRDPIAEEVTRNKKLEEVLIVYYNGRYQPDKCVSHRVEVDALDELRQLAGDENLLPIPVWVPDGFKLVKSHVFFGSKKGTTYQLMGEEYVEAGVSVKRYACDREKLRMCSYFLYFQNEAGERLNFSARMVMDYNADSVLQADGGQVNMKKVEGMDQVVHIDRGEDQFIWMRKNLLEPIPAPIMILGPDDIEISDVERSYVCLELQANSTVCDLDTMLSCFGLIAQ